MDPMKPASLRDRFRINTALTAVERTARFYWITPPQYLEQAHLDRFADRVRAAFTAGASLAQVATAAGLTCAAGQEVAR